MITRLLAGARLLRLAACLVAGRRFWIAPLLPLSWPALQALLLLTGSRAEGFDRAAAQNTLIGVPLAVLAIFLGVRIVAGEIEGRSLEIAYTVPGGAHRVWLIKLAAAWLLVVAAGALLAAVTFLFFTAFPPSALYGALQGASLYLVLAMATATLWRSEVAGAMSSSALLVLPGVLGGLGEVQLRASPFWNALAVAAVDRREVFAWTLQNRIGALLLMAAILALACGRAERRERMLGG